MLTYRHHTLICHTYVHKLTGSRAGPAENILFSRYYCIVISDCRIVAFFGNNGAVCDDFNNLLIAQMMGMDTIMMNIHPQIKQ